MLSTGLRIVWPIHLRRLCEPPAPLAFAMQALGCHQWCVCAGVCKEMIYFWRGGNPLLEKYRNVKIVSATLTLKIRSSVGFWFTLDEQGRLLNAENWSYFGRDCKRIRAMSGQTPRCCCCFLALYQLKVTSVRMWYQNHSVRVCVWFKVMLRARANISGEVFCVAHHQLLEQWTYLECTLGVS